MKAHFGADSGKVRQGYAADEHPAPIVHRGGAQHQGGHHGLAFRFGQVAHAHIQQSTRVRVQPLFERGAPVEGVAVLAIADAAVTHEHVIGDEAEDQRVQDVVGHLVADGRVVG